mmetsp:Transcript_18739/g.42974  ORF Transcript_18739/g.42974 Transcript_18739/m.42974 type:complete len:201 (-) Transcript_18739:4414-5016(-)
MNRFLHSRHQLVEVVLHISLRIKWDSESHFFCVVGNHLGHRVLLLFVEVHRSKRVKHVLKMNNNRVRVRPLRQDLQQNSVRAEIKSRETISLGLKISSERLLTHFKLFHQVRKQLFHNLVVTATLNAIRLLICLRGHLHEVLVNRGESFRFLWKLLRDVSAGEHSFHVDPQVLHLNPLLHHVRDCRKVRDPHLHFLPERS